MADDLQVTPTIILELPNRHAYLGVYYHRSEPGGVFVASNIMMEPGTQVQLEIVFIEEHRTFRSRGVVRWKRAQRTRHLASGLGIDFLDDERNTRDMLLEFANGRTIKLFARRARRLPVKLEVQYATHSVFLSDLTDDLSEGGLFIRTDNVLDVGTPLRLRLKPPGHMFAIQVRGEVAWRSDQGRRGFGVRFLFDKPSVKKKVHDVVGQIRERVRASFEFRIDQTRIR